MSDQIRSAATAAWAVQVTVLPLNPGGTPTVTLYYSAFDDPDDAVVGVRAYCGVGVESDTKVEIKTKLSPEAVAGLAEKYGFSSGKVMPWP